MKRSLLWTIFAVLSQFGHVACLSTPTNSPRPPSKASSSSRTRVKPIPYIATTSTVEHGKALSQYLKDGDRILELGTQLDASTDKILDGIGPTGSAVLVDIKRTETTSGRTSQGTRNPEKFRATDPSNGTSRNYQYLELDHFAQWKSIFDNNQSKKTQLFDIMILDATAMLGNDLELTTISVINEFINEMSRKNHRPRAVIVKSKSIASLARRLVHAQRLFDGSVVKDFKTPSRDGKPYIVAGVGVEEYRRTIPHVIQTGDEAVEVGCFSGVTTALVHEAADPSAGGYCIGVDIGPKIIQRAKKEHPTMKFSVGDGFRSMDLLRIKQASYPASSPESVFSGYDVVYADIGGLSGPDGLLESLSLMENLGNALEPRCICIKSLCMRRFASSLRSYSLILEAQEKKNTPSSAAN